MNDTLYRELGTDWRCSCCGLPTFIPAAIDKPMLGLATTRQLIEELSARIEMDGMLDYRTVDST